MAVILFMSAAGAAMMGRYRLTAGDIWKICTGTMEYAMKRDVFLKIRLPRIVFAGMAGAALSVSGMVYQEIFGNPLVSPDVMGVSGGACVGAVWAIALGAGPVVVQAFALSFGLFAVVLSVALARAMGRGRNLYLLLGGIVVKAAADAAVMAFKYMADPAGELAAMEYWLMGSFHSIRWADLKGAALVVIPMLFLLWLLRFPIAVLSLGDEEAMSLGLKAASVKRLCLGAATLLVAATVSVTGIVTWVGLIVPHMARFLTGKSLTGEFGFCAMAGAAFVIWMDTLARTLTEAELPVSILTSAAGGAFLLLVLFRRRMRGEETWNM